MLSTKSNGFSIVEVLIALALGMGALVAIASLVGYGIGVNSNLLASARLNEELGNAKSLMEADIRRAGYSGNTVAMLTDPAANPSPFNASIVVGSHPDEMVNSCILYSYDLNANGALDNAPSENFGFRMRNGAVQVRGNNALCNEDAGWIDLTDPSVVTTTLLVFNVVQAVDNGITSTQVTINLSGELAANDGISRRLQSIVAVRNYDG